MGTFGGKLYDNDYASDVRADYIEFLRSKLSDEAAAKQTILKHADVMGSEDEPLFWLALADTQWDYGRNYPEVLEKAQRILSAPVDEDRWATATEQARAEWEKSCQKLREKLSSPLPKRKRAIRRKQFHCPWKLGDVFAYRFHTEQSREAGLYGKYIVFRKVSEASWYPKHVIPVVKFYKAIFDQVPRLEDVIGLPELPHPFFGTLTKKFEIELISEHERYLPLEHLSYLGNHFSDDCVEFRGHRNIACMGWEERGGNWRIEEMLILALRNLNQEGKPDHLGW